MVRPGRESFKRFLKTITEQLPVHIEEYPPPDQVLLKDFLSVLHHYKEADYQRKRLSKRFEEYNNNILGTDQYLQTPFLWFTYNYFSNANLLLNVSKFHAHFFNEYLVKHLRGTSSTPGVYGLVRGNIPLSDLAWEQLQYESNKLLIPLTEDQIQILKTVYSFITEVGVYTLDFRKLRSVIVKQVKFPKNVMPSDELNRFFTRMDGRWFLRFSSPAFGLQIIFLHFQLQGSTSLKDIINFYNAANTVLTYNDVFTVRDQPKTYIGSLYVPTEMIGCLKSYLQKCERKGSIILKEMSRITSSHTSASLTQYRVKFGWIVLPTTKMRRLTQLLRSKHPKKSQREYNSLFVSLEFNHHWHYSQHPLPIEIIRLYCKLPQDYTFSNLPLINNQDLTTLSRAEIGLLKQLSYNQVVYIGFVPWRLVYEFSLDLYWIMLPKIPFYQLQHFLMLIPYSRIYFTEKSICIRARLTPKLVNWIENDLNWTVFSIVRRQYPLDLEFDWFDQTRLEWKRPMILDK